MAILRVKMVRRYMLSRQAPSQRWRWTSVWRYGEPPTPSPPPRDISSPVLESVRSTISPSLHWTRTSLTLILHHLVSDLPIYNSCFGIGQNFCQFLSLKFYNTGWISIYEYMFRLIGVSHRSPTLSEIRFLVNKKGKSPDHDFYSINIFSDP